MVGVIGFFASTVTANCFNKDLQLRIADWNDSKNSIESNDLQYFVQFFITHINSGCAGMMSEETAAPLDYRGLL